MSEKGEQGQWMDNFAWYESEVGNLQAIVQRLNSHAGKSPFDEDVQDCLMHISSVLMRFFGAAPAPSAGVAQDVITIGSGPSNSYPFQPEEVNRTLGPRRGKHIRLAPDSPRERMPQGSKAVATGGSAGTVADVKVGERESVHGASPPAACAASEQSAAGLCCPTCQCGTIRVPIDCSDPWYRQSAAGVGEAVSMSAERWLALTGFSDSRVHSSTEIAKLLEGFHGYKINEAHADELERALPSQVKVSEEQALNYRLNQSRSPFGPQTWWTDVRAADFAFSLAAPPAGERERLAGTLCRVAQLLDGWHQDGTAWSEWDESVRKEVSDLLRALSAAERKEDSTQPANEGGDKH